VTTFTLSNNNNYLPQIYPKSLLFDYTDYYSILISFPLSSLNPNPRLLGSGLGIAGLIFVSKLSIPISSPAGRDNNGKWSLSLVKC